MKYEGPRHERITKKLRKIAKQYGLKLWFRDVEFSGEYHVGFDRAVVSLNKPSYQVISTFFHELGHHLDYHNGKYPSFYQSTPLYKQRRVALKAELSADRLGQKLCKKYFPKIKYHTSYRTEEDLIYLEWYYSDGRTLRSKELTAMVKKAKV